MFKFYPGGGVKYRDNDKVLTVSVEAAGWTVHLCQVGLSIPDYIELKAKGRLLPASSWSVCKCQRIIITEEAESTFSKP